MALRSNSLLTLAALLMGCSQETVPVPVSTQPLVRVEQVGTLETTGVSAGETESIARDSSNGSPAATVADSSASEVCLALNSTQAIQIKHAKRFLFRETRDPDDLFRPALAFSAFGDNGFTARLKIFLSVSKTGDDPPDIAKVVESLATPYVTGSVEQSVESRELQLEKSVGRIASFTDARLAAAETPPPGEFRVVTVGAIPLSGFLAEFRLFTDNTTDGDFADALAIVRSLAIVDKTNGENLRRLDLSNGPAPAPAAEKRLVDEIHRAESRHAAVLDELDDLALAGELEQSIEKLIAVADADPTAGTLLVVANQLYRAAPDRSFDLHRRAYALAPGEELTNLEMALQWHRRGQHAQAIPHYQQYQRVAPLDHAPCALLAGCLVETGQLDSAVDAWRIAYVEQTWPRIEELIAALTLQPDRTRERYELLQKTKGDDSAAAVSLGLLDMKGSPIIESTTYRFPLFDRDRALIAATLGEQSASFEQLLALETCLITLKDPRVNIATVIGETGYIVDGLPLPDDSRLAARLMGILPTHKLEVRSDLLRWHAAELERRAFSEAGDSEALNLLAHLVGLEDRPRLAELDRYGWDRYQEARYAVGYLNAAEDLGPDHADVQRALREFPEHSVNWANYVQLKGLRKVSMEELSRAICSEFHGVSIVDDVPNLSLYFEELTRRLKSSPNE